MQNQNTTRKPYTPPTVTEHGNAVQSTKGPVAVRLS